MLFDAPAKKSQNGIGLEISIAEIKPGEDDGSYTNPERTPIALKSLNAGLWTLDISANTLTICKRSNEIVPIGGLKNINIKSLCDLIVAEYKVNVIETLLLAIREEGSFDMEVPMIPVSGSCPKWLRIAGTAEYDNTHFRRKIHGIIEDISARKNREFLQQDLLAMVSHELRSPLSVVKLYIQLCDQLASDAGNDRISEMLKKAGLQVHKMNRMIRSYLESSALESGKITYFPTSFDVEELLKEVIADVYLLHPGHVLFLKPGPSIEVYADRDKIGQVVQNLLTNAIKYSSQRRVITIQFKKAVNYLQVTVKDHGIGIKGADQEKIFDRFYRVTGESGTTVKGYGIGLSLSKEIIKHHNGDIWLKSEVNKGCRFYFTLPLS